MAPKKRSISLIVLAFAAGAWPGNAGCSGKSIHAEAEECSSDSECATGEVCVHRDPGRRPSIDMACRWPICSSAEQCASGLVCGPTPPHGRREACGPLSCLESCAVMGCQPDELCREDGVCELVSCDAPDAAPCPEHWQCDPSRSADESETISGSSVDDAPDPARAIRRGCVRLRCDEPDGYACSETHVCAPERALEIGCAPAPCSETGHCPDETKQVCAATSPWPPPALPDAFGCVPKHCEQGYECRYDVSIGWDAGIANTLDCDPSAPDANPYGCAPVTCEDEPSWCDPVHALCDPTHAQANLLGCVRVDNSSGGGSGGGQGGSGAGASSGGTAASGAVGHCAPASSN